MSAATADARTMEEALRFRLIFEHAEVKRGLAVTRRLAKGVAVDAGRSFKGAEQKARSFGRQTNKAAQEVRKFGRGLSAVGDAFSGISSTGGRAVRTFGRLTSSLSAAGGKLGLIGLGAAAAVAGFVGAGYAATKLTQALVKTTANARETYDSLQAYKDVPGFLPEVSSADLKNFDQIKASVEATKVTFQAAGLVIAREFAPTLRGLAVGMVTGALAIKKMLIVGANLWDWFGNVSWVIKANFLPAIVAAQTSMGLLLAPITILLGPIAALAAGIWGLGKAFLALEDGALGADEQFRSLMSISAKNAKVAEKVAQDEKRRAQEKFKQQAAAEKAARAAAAAERQRAADLSTVNGMIVSARIKEIAATDEYEASIAQLLNGYDQQFARLTTLKQQHERAIGTVREGSEAWKEHKRILEQITAAQQQLSKTMGTELSGIDQKQAQAQQQAIADIARLTRQLHDGQLEGEARVRSEARARYREVAALQANAVEQARGNANLIAAAEEEATRARLQVEKQLQRDLAQLRKEAREKEQRQTLDTINQIGQYAQQGASLLSGAYDESFQTSADNVSRLQNLLMAGEEHYTTAQKRALRARIEAQKDAARKQFNAAKAAKSAEAMASTALAAINAIAQSPPPSPWGIIGAGIATAAGLKAVQEINSQQPTFHRGGFADEVPATLTRREAVLSPIGRQSLGDDTIRAANAGQGGGSRVQVVTVDRYQQRVFGRAIRDNLSIGGELRNAIHANTTGGHRGSRKGL